MINPAIFKAYDIRGRYPEEINEEAVAKIASVLAGHFKKGLPAGRQGKVVIGHDARLSSPSLYKAVLKELERTHKTNRSNKSNRSNRTYGIISAGMITTPMFYFLVNKLKAVGGIMVTASHNPKEFNGLKVVGPKAEVISGREIHDLIGHIGHTS